MPTPNVSGSPKQNIDGNHVHEGRWVGGIGAPDVDGHEPVRVRRGASGTRQSRIELDQDGGRIPACPVRRRDGDHISAITGTEAQDRRRRFRDRDERLLEPAAHNVEPA